MSKFKISLLVAFCLSLSLIGCDDVFNALGDWANTDPAEKQQEELENLPTVPLIGLRAVREVSEGFNDNTRSHPRKVCDGYEVTAVIPPEGKTVCPGTIQVGEAFEYVPHPVNFACNTCPEKLENVKILTQPIRGVGAGGKQIPGQVVSISDFSTENCRFSAVRKSAPSCPHAFPQTFREFTTPSN